MNGVSPKETNLGKLLCLQHLEGPHQAVPVLFMLLLVRKRRGVTPRTPSLYGCCHATSEIRSSRAGTRDFAGGWKVSAGGIGSSRAGWAGAERFLSISA